MVRNLDMDGHSWAITLYKEQHIEKNVLLFNIFYTCAPVDPLDTFDVREENPSWKFLQPRPHHLQMSPKLSNGWTTSKCRPKNYQTVESRILNTFQSDWLLTSLSGPRANAWPLANRSLPFCLCRYLFFQVLGVENCIGGGRGHDTCGRQAERKSQKLVSMTVQHDV